MAKLLQEHRLDVGHEFWGKDGISWFHCTGDPTLKVMNAQVTLVHLVREPIKVIASMTTANLTTWKLMFNKMGLEMPENVVERSMLAWLKWNELADKQTNLRVRVEDVEKWFNPVCAQAGFPVQLKKNFQTPRNTNTRDHLKLTWDNCAKLNPELTEKICAKTQSYGYGL